MKSIISLILAIIIAVLLGLGIANSAPFLVCDTYPPAASGAGVPTEFEVYFDGSLTAVVSPAEVVSGGVRLHYDVGSLAVGDHTVMVKAVRLDVLWGRSPSESSVPFVFTKPGRLGKPSGIGLEP